MNYFRVKSALIAGIQAVPIVVECAQSRRLPYLQILGGSSGASGELRERVIAALGTLEGGKFRLPARRFTVQLRPGAQQLPLEQLDLAVAVALLGSAGMVPPDRVEGLLVSGRLGLDGSISGAAAPAALRRLLRESGAASALLALECSEALEEPQLERGGGFRSLSELVAFLRAAPSRGRRAMESRAAESEAPEPSRIWSRIAGQVVAERLLEVSAAGGHHVLIRGRAGARADLLAHALSSLLPPLGRPAMEEVRDVYALAGMEHVVPTRPFHVFGSRPGLSRFLEDRSLQGVEEILLAHRGVLLVENAVERESTLFPLLEPPMLQGLLPARLQGRSGQVPAEFVVVASSPLCGCGAAGDPRLSCSCRPTEAKRYLSRLRRLLRFPFDLSLKLAPATSASNGVSWADASARVEEARGRMAKRQGKGNARLGEVEVRERMAWSAAAVRLWEALEGRSAGQGAAFLACARVAATICDLRAGEEISECDVLEALHYFPDAGSGRAESPSVPPVNSMAIP